MEWKNPYRSRVKWPLPVTPAFFSYAAGFFGVITPLKYVWKDRSETPLNFRPMVLGAHFTHSTIANNRFWGPLKVSIQHHPTRPFPAKSRQTLLGVHKRGWVGGEAILVKSFRYQKCRVLRFPPHLRPSAKPWGVGQKSLPIPIGFEKHLKWGGIWTPKTLPSKHQTSGGIWKAIGLNETDGFFSAKSG